MIQMLFTCHHAIINSHISMHAQITNNIFHIRRAITTCNHQFTCHQYQFIFQKLLTTTHALISALTIGILALTIHISTLAVHMSLIAIHNS